METLKTKKHEKPKRMGAFKKLLLASSLAAALAFPTDALARDGATAAYCRSLAEKAQAERNSCASENYKACERLETLLKELRGKCSDVDYEARPPAPAERPSYQKPSKRIHY